MGETMTKPPDPLIAPKNIKTAHLYKLCEDPTCDETKWIKSMYVFCKKHWTAMADPPEDLEYNG